MGYDVNTQRASIEIVQYFDVPFAHAVVVSADLLIDEHASMISCKPEQTQGQQELQDLSCNC